MLASLTTIAVLHWAVLMLPGFNFLLIGQLAAAGQRGTAMSAVAGMTAATLMWALLAVAGVGIVFTAYPAVRQAAQIAGGLYLIYLAIKLWQAGQAPDPALAQVMRPGAAFRVGFVTGALNPKIALFYGSVFESPRELRRLQPLRRWSHEEIKQVFPRSTRTRGPYGAGAPRR
ncbi:MAG: LysE family translocator, partial [Polaromonas sp.]|nr:LysE family translocator [Polaromonas sp.]